MHLKPLLLNISLAILLLPALLTAAIINVPEDYETIQAAVDATEEGDTVLIDEGEYLGGIVMPDYDITLASMYLIEADEDYISNTIISGSDDDRSGIVFSYFYPHDHEGTLICGLTIRDCETDYGGGIYLSTGSPTIRDLVIRNNSVTGNGSAVYMTFDRGENHPVFQNILVLNNEIEDYNGQAQYGAIATRSRAYLDATFINVTIIDNNGYGFSFRGENMYCTNLVVRNNDRPVFIRCGETGEIDGGIISGNGGDDVCAIWGSGDLEFNDLLIYDNENDEPGGVVISCNIGSTVFSNCTIVNAPRPANTLISTLNNDLSFQNTIVWGIDYGQPAWAHNSSYCVIENYVGEDTTITAENPHLWNVELGDLRLAPGSSAIDAGDPELEDPDGSRLDIGAIPYDGRTALLTVTVLEVDGRAAVDSAHIILQSEQEGYTDENGQWTTEILACDEMYVTAYKDGYNPLRYYVEDVELDDDIEIELELGEPEIELSAEQIDLTIDALEQGFTQFDISNNGSGELEWRLEKHIGEPPYFDPLGSNFNVNVTDSVANSTLYGLVIIDGEYYVSGGASGNLDGDGEQIYVIDSTGVLQRQFEVPLDWTDRNPVRSMATDGETIWATTQQNLYNISTDGELLSHSVVEGDIRLRSLCWDIDGERLIGTELADVVFSLNDEGEILDTLVYAESFEIAALGYLPDAPDSSALYMLNRLADGSLSLWKANLITGEYDWVDYFLDRNIRDVHMLPYTNPFAIQMAYVYSGSGNSDDFLKVVSADVKDEWIQFEPVEGSLNPDQQQSIDLTFSAIPNLLGDYRADLWLHNNTLQTPIILPVYLTVDPTGVVEDVVAPPEDFEILSVHPNPFNSLARISYRLPARAEVKIAVFDLDGRRVAEYGMEHREAGRHSETIDADGWSSGVYFVRLTVNHSQQTIKIALVK